jgi:hypothetical protein
MGRFTYLLLAWRIRSDASHKQTKRGLSTFRPHRERDSPVMLAASLALLLTGVQFEDEHNDAAAYEPQISATLDSALSCGRTYVHAHGQSETIERCLRCCSRRMRSADLCGRRCLHVRIALTNRLTVAGALPRAQHVAPLAPSLGRCLSQGGHWFETLAERVGFEPTSRLRSLRFSSRATCTLMYKADT